MKTSNILIITYLFVIFVGLAVLYFDDMQHYVKFRHQQEKEIMQKYQLHKSTADLPQFSVIVDTTGHSFTITTGKSNQLIVFDKATEISPEVYKIRNDTLYINKIPKGAKVNLIVENISSIVAKKGANIAIDNASFDALHLKLTSSKLTMSHMKIGVLNLDLEDEAYCYANDINVTTIDAKLYHSHFERKNSKVHRSSESNFGDREEYKRAIIRH
jgi:hypothetical protein